MDSGLVAWARQVKRHHQLGVPLWFFTDDQRLEDPLPIIRTLPPGLCGVVLRHDNHPDRLALARAIARCCRQRKLTLVIAGDALLAKCLRVGLHVRGGAGGRPHGWTGGVLSASVHNATQLRQARRAKMDLAFISPVFATASHPGAPVLGPYGWRRLAMQAKPMKPCALGGIKGGNVRTLSRLCTGVGAIDAFL